MPLNTNRFILAPLTQNDQNSLAAAQDFLRRTFSSEDNSIIGGNFSQRMREAMGRDESGANVGETVADVRAQQDAIRAQGREAKSTLQGIHSQRSVIDNPDNPFVAAEMARIAKADAKAEARRVENDEIKAQNAIDTQAFNDRQNAQADQRNEEIRRSNLQSQITFEQDNAIVDRRRSASGRVFEVVSTGQDFVANDAADPLAGGSFKRRDFTSLEQARTLGRSKRPGVGGTTKQGSLLTEGTEEGHLIL